jgi:hypothetical protein
MGLKLLSRRSAPKAQWLVDDLSDSITNFVLPLKAVTTFQELGIIAQGTLSDLPELDAP